MDLQTYVVDAIHHLSMRTIKPYLNKIAELPSPAYAAKK
jgi:hypothetical protein